MKVKKIPQSELHWLRTKKGQKDLIRIVPDTGWGHCPD